MMEICPRRSYQYGRIPTPTDAMQYAHTYDNAVSGMLQIAKREVVRRMKNRWLLLVAVSTVCWSVVVISAQAGPYEYKVGVKFPSAFVSEDSSLAQRGYYESTMADLRKAITLEAAGLSRIDMPLEDRESRNDAEFLSSNVLGLPHISSYGRQLVTPSTYNKLHQTVGCATTINKVFQQTGDAGDDGGAGGNIYDQHYSFGECSGTGSNC